MKPAQFEYHRPTTLSGVMALLATHGAQAQILAGGQSLIPRMRRRDQTPGHLIDLKAVAALGGVRVAGRSMRLGAMCRLDELIANSGLARLCPLLREAAREIGDAQVRAASTVGGNVASGDPNADLPAALICLDARYTLRTAEAERTLPARDFYQRAWRTRAEPTELLTEILFPAPPLRHGWAFEKQSRRLGADMNPAVAVFLTLEGERCASAAIALAGVDEKPAPVEESAAALIGAQLDEAAIEAAATAVWTALRTKAAAHARVVAPTADAASGELGETEEMADRAAYVAHLARELTRRALRRARDRAAHKT